MGFFTKSPHFLHVIFSVELQVAVLDPAEAAADHIDERSKDGGQHDGDEDEAQPVKAVGLMAAAPLATASSLGETQPSTRR